MDYVLQETERNRQMVNQIAYKTFGGSGVNDAIFPAGPEVCFHLIMDINFMMFFRYKIGLFFLTRFSHKFTPSHNYYAKNFKPQNSSLHNRRAFCMRMRQYGLLKCHRGIFLWIVYVHYQYLQAVFWSWMTCIGCYVPQTCSLRYRGICTMKVSLL